MCSSLIAVTWWPYRKNWTPLANPSMLLVKSNLPTQTTCVLQEMGYDRKAKTLSMFRLIGNKRSKNSLPKEMSSCAEPTIAGGCYRSQGPNRGENLELKTKTKLPAGVGALLSSHDLKTESHKWICDLDLKLWYPLKEKLDLTLLTHAYARIHSILQSRISNQVQLATTAWMMLKAGKSLLLQDFPTYHQRRYSWTFYHCEICD